MQTDKKLWKIQKAIHNDIFKKINARNQINSNRNEE